MVEGSETEQNEGRPRYWRTPSVVVSDYSDYSYLDEKLERNDLDLEKYEGTSGTPSQASSCSCLDCDEIRESLDTQFLQVCRSSRRHSDFCCLCPDSVNAVAVRYLISEISSFHRDTTVRSIHENLLQKLERGWKQEELVPGLHRLLLLKA